ncbi:MAG: hypothetical protein IJS33_05270 [Firmicutes bacterium]|nr:hypothetical protein [Bacillota bacterium]
MKQIDRVLVHDIAEENIVSQTIIKRMHSYSENAKMWKGAFAAFLISLVIHFLLRVFFSESFPGGYEESKVSFFLMMMMWICFAAFAILFIREKSLLKKKCTCPNCGEGFAYFTSESEKSGQCGRKYFLDDCNTVGIKQGKVKGSPFILPKNCPNCNEKIWKE